MLTDLHIENFAIIHKLELHPGDGLLIFTGETGAGKSIILDAIMALVGGKVDGSMVRSGEPRATVEAGFTIPENAQDQIQAILKREELDEGEPYLTLAREIRAEGRHVARVNGRSVSTGILKELGNYLVDIHGQSEHLSLLDVHSHLGLLDRFAADERHLAAYQAEYHELQRIRKELKNLREMEQESAKRSELLQFQLNEIEAARLEEGEEEELAYERNRLANAEALALSAQETLALLDEGDPETSSAADLLGQAEKSLAAIARIDTEQASLAEQLESVTANLAEISRDLRAYLDSIEFNPKRLEQVETRIELIHQLKRKYGGTVESVLAYGREAKEQLELVGNAGERIRELESAEADVLKRVTLSAEMLSQVRQQAAQRLSSEVEGELNDLSLAGARFSISFESSSIKAGSEKKPVFKETGIDEVEFLIAPNPGEGLKPLVKIASGGETSRLMLALKNVLTKADYIPTLIFDEIDQGIGGKVGSVVGEKMWQLGRRHQVMCVTHLPQLAAFGDEHYQVSKAVFDERTMTSVKELGTAERIQELAQMTGNTAESGLRAAEEILQQARERQTSSTHPMRD